MHNYTSSSSDFDGRRLNNLLSSWKKISWNERRDKNTKLRESNHPWLSSNAFHKECRDEVSEQPNCQRRDLKQLNSVGKVLVQAQRLGGICQEQHATDEKYPTTRNTALQLLKMAAVEDDVDDDTSVSSTQASDQPIDYLLHYSQYLLLRHADDTKSLSTPSCCGKTHIKHVHYSAHQEHISMSLDYYVSKWEEHQEREFEDLNEQAPQSLLCGNSKVKCKEKDCKTKLLITSIIISIILFAVCDIQQHLTNNDIWIMNRILMQAHYESTNRYFTEVTENILTSQLSIVSPKMQNLEATSEILTVSNPADRKNEQQLRLRKLLQNFSSREIMEVPEYSTTVAEIVTIPELTVRNKEGQKLLLNFSSPTILEVSNYATTFAQIVSIPEPTDRNKERKNLTLIFSSLSTMDVSNNYSAATMRKKAEKNLYHSSPKFLEFHRKRQVLLDNSNTYNYGEIFTKEPVKVRLSSALRKGCGETNFVPQSSFFPDFTTLPPHLQSIFVYSELHATSCDSKTDFGDSETKLPKLVYPNVLMLEEDGEGFLETPLTDIFGILFKQLSSKVQIHTRRGNIGLWGLRIDQKKGCSFGLNPC